MGQHSKASNQRKSKSRSPDYNASMSGTHETFAMMYDSMLKHPTFIMLSPTAKIIYMLCRNQATCKEGRQCLYNHSKKTGVIYPENCFVFPARHLEQYGYADRGNATKYLKELINAGFIKIYEQNGHRFKLNIYQFSSVWKDK